MSENKKKDASKKDGSPPEPKPILTSKSESNWTPKKCVVMEVQLSKDRESNEQKRKK